MLSDIKLRATGKALKSWSSKHVGNVQLQLAIAKEIVFRLDCAEEHRCLAPHEVALHKIVLDWLLCSELSSDNIPASPTLLRGMRIGSSSTCKHAIAVAKGTLKAFVWGM